MIPRTPDVRERSIFLCSCGASNIRGPGYHVKQRDQWVSVQSAYVTSVV